MKNLTNLLNNTVIILLLHIILIFIILYNKKKIDNIENERKLRASDKYNKNATNILS